ncbi:hypothetical protein Rsub_06409 [Raphidocelis subcapitata]|uniref:RAP domain-containing protein n=1 Tax=Raphidocelis subcapitata TaxID=307507 RepID=A0A2V0P0G8_9CHLO|nr:hypothetical protein Rsub_06409 [Raphidocelis subcapitata]|eukprot:GBF93371.1 hypothetical protein Rsub_06409 [Raphidocelis subcapitata]
MRPFRTLAGAVAAARGLLDSGSASGAVQQGLPYWRARNAPAATGSGSSSGSTTAADQKQQQQRQQPQPQQSKLSRRQGRSAGSSRGRVGGNHTISPPRLTALIKGAGSLDALQQLEAQHGDGFNHIHAAAAFTRAAHLVSSGAARPLDAHPLMRRLSARLWLLLDDCGTQAFANTLWACGKTAYVDAALLDACFERLAAGAGEAALQELANALYAAAPLRAAGYSVDRRHAAQLLSALVAQRQEANPQALANALWAAATLQLGVSEQHAAQLLSALVAQRQDAKPQELANALWAAATLQLVVSEQHAAQLLSAVVAQRQATKPQDISNALWAAATLQLAVSDQHAVQLLSALVAQRQATKPQDISNALWAAATLQLAVPDQQAAHLLSALVAQRQAAKPQDISNALWATAKQWSDAAPPGVEVALLHLAAAVDERLVAAMNGQDVSNSLWALSQLGLRPAPLTQRLAEAAVPLAPAMTPQALANTAAAAAKLVGGGARLFAALAGAAERQVQHFTTQELCNLAWALAVADQRQLAGAAAALARRAATARVRSQTVAEDRCQLYQVHLWLMDGQRADSASGSSGSGLAGALTAAQLQQCKEAWEAGLQEAAQQHRRSAFERSVFECARRLPGLADCRVLRACGLPRKSQLQRRDADGPTHFLRPGREVGGDTLARNRALSARGCVVVSVPYWEWDQVRRDAGKAAAHLSQAVEDAVARWRRRPQQGGNSSSGSRGSGKAAPAA